MSVRGWIRLDYVPYWNRLLQQTWDAGDYCMLIVRIAAGPCNFLCQLVVICFLTLMPRFELLLHLRESFLWRRHHIGLATKGGIHFILSNLQNQCPFCGNIFAWILSVCSLLWNDIIKAKLCCWLFLFYFVLSYRKGTWYAFCFNLVDLWGEIFNIFSLKIELQISVINLALLGLKSVWIYFKGEHNSTYLRFHCKYYGSFLSKCESWKIWFFLHV